jgi:hypothetical protein
MATKIASFIDYCKVNPPSKEQAIEWKDTLTASPVNSYSPANATSTDNVQCLQVTLEATHSALFNLNKRMYIPSRMEDGVRTFLDRPKPAKILKHHNDMADPVGIIRHAEYVSTIPDYLSDDKDVKILTDSSFPVDKQIAAMNRFMDSGIPFSDDWRGLGYIKLVADILDDDAIKSVQRGLFDAVSTSFDSPGEVYCSVCGQNWIKDGICDHEPGVVYEDEDAGTKRVCSLVPGAHHYKECSFVVMDGDPITVVNIGITDSVKSYNLPVEDWTNSSVTKSSEFVYEFKDYHKEENNMTNPATEPQLSDAEMAVMEVVKKLRPELNEDSVLEFVKKIAPLKQEDGFYPDQVEAEIDEDTAILFALEELENADQEINADEIYQEMEKELEAEGLEDAKLSTEKRNSLPGSKFCGPEKSFPVPDCAHVTAARRLIGRYKGPGSKANILACVNRKAKALGCENKKDQEAPDAQVEPKEEVKFSLPSCDNLKTLGDQEAQTLFAMAESELISRDLKVQRECSKCAESADLIKIAEDKNKINEEEIDSLKDTLRILRAEMKFQMEDYFNQVDQYVDLKMQLDNLKKENLAIMSVLDGKHDNIETAIESFKDADLDKEALVFKESFNLEDVVARLNNGMANNNPEGKVEDPTECIDGDNIQLPQNLTAPAQAAVDNIKLYISDGQVARAKQLYGKMVSLKVIDQDKVPFDSLSVDKKTETTE